MESDWPSRNKGHYITEIVSWLGFADVIFGGDKRQPEIHLRSQATKPNAVKTPSHRFSRAFVLCPFWLARLLTLFLLLRDSIWNLLCKLGWVIASSRESVKHPLSFIIRRLHSVALTGCEARRDVPNFFSSFVFYFAQSRTHLCFGVKSACQNTVLCYPLKLRPELSTTWALYDDLSRCITSSTLTFILFSLDLTLP